MSKIASKDLSQIRVGDGTRRGDEGERVKGKFVGLVGSDQNGGFELGNNLGGTFVSDSIRMEEVVFEDFGDAKTGGFLISNEAETERESGIELFDFGLESTSSVHLEVVGVERVPSKDGGLFIASARLAVARGNDNIERICLIDAEIKVRSRLSSDDVTVLDLSVPL